MSTGYRTLMVAVIGAFMLATSHGRNTAAANEPPVAEAGLPRYAANLSVQLDGRGSYDPDGPGPLSYTWTQVSGPPVVITRADTATPTVSGFVQKEQIQECEFELVVNDGQSASLPDKAKVIIVPTFTNCTMTLENPAFDPGKPTVIFFHGGTSEQTGGGKLNDPIWSSKANIISFPSYVADPGTFSGAQTERSYQRPGDRVIVYLSATAPDYRQPIQTFGWSIGGLLALEVALRLNVTYADPRYAVNHACLIDPSAWVMGTPEFHRRVALLLANPVEGEQCWVASLEAANVSVCPSALNVVFAADHALPWNWYRNSLATVESTPFNHGVVGGAYWSVLGPGRNLQLASTPGVETYKFRWTGSATAGQIELFDESAHPGRLPEPVTLGAWVSLNDMSGAQEGAVLSCHESENAVGYELLMGSDPYRVMDFRVVSDTPLPPMDVVRDLPFEETWWTVRARDRFGSTIHADPVRLDLMSLAALPVENTRTGRRYGLIEHALLVSEPGDTLILDPLVYEVNLRLAMPLTIRSLDPNDPIIVAGTILRGRGSEPTVTFAGRKNAKCTLAGLTVLGETVAISCCDAVPTIRDCAVESPDGIAVEFWHGHRPEFVNCTFIGRVKEGGDPGLIAYWKLDETEGTVAHDSEGENDAIVIGAPMWWPEGGRMGGGLELDGVHDHVRTEFVCNPSLGAFSVFAWIKGGTPGEVILSQAGAANWLMADAGGGVLSTELKGLGRFGKVLTSNQTITDGSWHRVGLTWDGVTRILYVDNVEVASDAQSNPATAWDGLHIGAGSTLMPGTFWSGLIDDVWVYDRAVEP